MTALRDPVLYDKTGDGIALVTLNRPEVLNAYNVAMRDALYEVLGAVRDDPEVRVLVLFGAGRAFCSGGDLREFGTAPSPAMARAVRWWRDVWGVLRGLRQITIAAVQGVAAGGGMEMVLLCDRCIASRDAEFFLPETGLGMIPGVGGTQTLSRVVGLATAMSLVLEGRRLDAATAARLGIVSRVVARERLRPAALTEARRLARLAPHLTGTVKRLIDESLDAPLGAGLASEARLAALLR